jgi:protein-S-isoprenylcysteine O-methyltransferase Ste14
MPVCSTKKIPHSTCRSGTALAVLGLALAVAGVAAVIRHRTTIVPHHRVATLLTGGAYGLSRNPMYTGLAIAYLGLALLLDSWWTLALWPLVIVAVRQLVIRPEEQYLTQAIRPALHRLPVPGPPVALATRRPANQERS